MPPIISVENLGKRYTLRHESGAGGGYRRLSEELVTAVKKPFKRNGVNPTVESAREDFWALKDVSFELQQGEVLGIVGRNGAGKSTLLKILSRITEPTEGRVSIRGRVASLLEVGTGFHPELTGRENIFLNGAILGMTRAEIRRKFDEIVAFAEVEKFLDTPVKRYSSGMYVRLAFAVAAHLEPEILVVDEVLAVGDAEFQKKCLGKMKDVTATGRTVLFVSHNLAAINSLCKRCCLFELGKLAGIGPTASLVATYLGRGSQRATSYSTRSGAQRIGNSPISLLTVSIESDDGGSGPSFPADSKLHLRICYVLHDAARGIRIGFHLHTADGTIVFTATDADNTDAAAASRRPAGKYESCCTIPAYFLNEGHFSVSVGSDIPGFQLNFLFEHVICFAVGPLRYGGNAKYDGRPGIVCPDVLWKVHGCEPRSIVPFSCL